MISIEIVPPGGCTVCSSDCVTECLLRALNTAVNNCNDVNPVVLTPIAHMRYIKALRLVAPDEIITPLNAILERLNKGHSLRVSAEKKEC